MVVSQGRLRPQAEPKSAEINIVIKRQNCDIMQKRQGGPIGDHGPSSMTAPPVAERHGGNGSHRLSANNNKVNCHLAARRSWDASKTDPSARAADLVLFNEM